MGEDRTYVKPKLTKYRFPNPVFDDENREVAGSVHVCFVVTADGRLVDPFILRSASPLLEGPVLEVLKGFRAIPARLVSVPIAVVEVLKFAFGPPPAAGLSTNNPRPLRLRRDGQLRVESHNAPTPIGTLSANSVSFCWKYPALQLPRQKL